VREFRGRSKAVFDRSYRFAVFLSKDVGRPMEYGADEGKRFDSVADPPL
jgi:hypothetical protein